MAMKHWKLPLVVLFFALVLILVSCSKYNASAPSPTPTPEPTHSSPSVTPTQSPSVTPAQSPTASVIAPVYLYVVGDIGVGLRLYREVHRFAVTSDRGLSALRILLNQRFHPGDPDYSNFWANGSVIHGITRKGSLATVDLTIAHLNVGAEGEMRAIDQLVWTLTANDYSIRSVKFRHKGKLIESFAGHVDTTGTFTRGSAADVLASVWVSSLTVHAGGEVVASGVACTFEAAVPWRLYRSGTVVRSGMTMATGGCPIRGAWKVTMAHLPKGTYVFVARDLSPKNGSVISQDSKSFSVR